MNLLLKIILGLGMISSNLPSGLQTDTTAMQYLIGCREVGLHLLSRVFDLINKLAKLFLVDSVVGLLLLSHSLTATYWGVKFDRALLLFVECLQL